MNIVLETGMITALPGQAYIIRSRAGVQRIDDYMGRTKVDTGAGAGELEDRTGNWESKC